MSNRDLVAKALSDIRTEIADTEQHLDDLRLQLKGAEALMDRLSRMRATGAAEAAAERAASNGGAAKENGGLADTMLAILASAPDGMTLQAIQAKMAEAGRSLSDERIRSTVKYLRRRGDAENLSRGLWRAVVAASRAEDSPQTTEDPAELRSAGSSVLPIRPASRGGEDGTSPGDRNDHVLGWHDSDHRHPSVVEG